MITEQQFLDTELAMGIGFHNPAFIDLCNSTAEIVKSLPDVKTILDYGGGTGVYSKAFQDAGFEVAYFDIFKPHNEYVKKNAPTITRAKKPITTDLMAFIEVAEHMTDEELENLFKQISPKYILFSSTSDKTDNDEEWGHINLKEQDEWIEFWKEKGYVFVANVYRPTPWAKLFMKNESE